jgi:hypothetical protein
METVVEPAMEIAGWGLRSGDIPVAHEMPVFRATASQREPVPVGWFGVDA